ncbi:MAG TPA: branched-chain amino acid ABC transporter permease [Alphaproteobacteria bacterium]
MLDPTLILVDGVVYASWLFLVAVGLTLIYGVMNILNVAHGSLYALGAFTAAWAVGEYLGGGGSEAATYVLLLLSAIAVGLVFGVVIERGVLRWMYGRDEIVIVLVTYAVFLILEDLIKLVFGVQSYMPYQPRNLLGYVNVGAIPFAAYDFCLIALAVVVGLAVWFGVNRTRPGKLLHAVIYDREISRALGIDVTRVFTVTFVIGAMLGALGGAATAPMISVVPGIGVEIIVLAFAVVVIGGLGSIEGAAIGALLVGLGRTLAVNMLPEVELFIVYGVMALVLVIRPQGLFGRAEARKI